MAGIRLVKLLLKLINNIRLYAWSTRMPLNRRAAELLAKELEEHVDKLVRSCSSATQPALGKDMRVRVTLLADNQIRAYLESAAAFMASDKFAQEVLQGVQDRQAAADLVVSIKRALFTLGEEEAGAA